jgi:hypothetical protein
MSGAALLYVLAIGMYGLTTVIHQHQGRWQLQL